MKKYNDTNFITGIRAIAVLMVFLVHSGGGILRDISPYVSGLVDSGMYGVQIFFVISGFTIFYQIYKSGYNYQQFLIIRLLRISIPYYPVLIIMFSLYYMGYIEPGGWAELYNNGTYSLYNLFMHLSYLGGFSGKYQNTILMVEWTLYVEVFYYLVIGGIVCHSIKTKTKPNYILLFVLSFAMYVAIKYVAKNDVIDPNVANWYPFKYMIMFLVGGMAYKIRYSIKTNSILSDASLLLILVTILLSPIIGTTLTEILMCLSVMLSIIFIKNGTFASRLLNSRIIQFYGVISYSFYLWHMPVFNILRKFGINGAEFIIYSFAITTMVSTASYVFLEKGVYSKLKNMATNKDNNFSENYNR
ncbi:acyltransferase [Citrobacter amalonaticus]|uniref:acyltransferase family protein n=1 Tax=Citrobacter amalonaticus TaxID=35703 RepID=UPI00292B92C1|nr:acyltransferase [Citrobacter amalonaticus]MDV0787663.1 acyltransferase [Citrobacter amalonaticus]MEB0643727.1 acyltransferase [Citrobacter amalonaticus]